MAIVTAEADPFASVVSEMKTSMPKGEDIVRSAAIPAPSAALRGTPPTPAPSKLAPAPSVAGAKLAAHAHALAASGAFDAEDFQRRASALLTLVSTRTAIVARQHHALKRMQLEIGALHGPQRTTVEELRQRLSALSAEVEAARQAFEAAKREKAGAEARVTELSDMKEALIERLTALLAETEAAKARAIETQPPPPPPPPTHTHTQGHDGTIRQRAAHMACSLSSGGRGRRPPDHPQPPSLQVRKIEELMGSLETLDEDALNSQPEVMARTAAAAAEAVRRGGAVGSSSTDAALSKSAAAAGGQRSADAHARTAVPPLEESAPAFDGF